MNDLLLSKSFRFLRDGPQQDVEQLMHDATLWVVGQQEVRMVVCRVHDANPGSSLGIAGLDLGDRFGEAEAAHELAVNVPVLEAKPLLPDAADRLQIGIGKREKKAQYLSSGRGWW